MFTRNNSLTLFSIPCNRISLDWQRSLGGRTSATATQSAPMNAKWSCTARPTFGGSIMQFGCKQRFAAVSIVCLGASLALATAQQVLGGITGTVLDKSQATIGSAQITATNTATDWLRTT